MKFSLETHPTEIAFDYHVHTNDAIMRQDGRAGTLSGHRAFDAAFESK